MVVVEAGVTPLLVDLLRNTPEPEVREQSIWALGNIAGDSTRTRDIVLASGAMEQLVRTINQHPRLLSTVRNATWTISNLCRGKPPPSFEAIQMALPTLTKLILEQQDEEILIDACNSLASIADSAGDASIAAIVNSGVCGRLVAFLGHTSYTMVVQTLPILCTLASGNDLHTQYLLGFPALLPALKSLLSSPKKMIRRMACTTLSHLAAGTSSQIQALIDANIIPQVVQLMVNEDQSIRKEALLIITNISSGNGSYRRGTGGWGFSVHYQGSGLHTDFGNTKPSKDNNEMEGMAAIESLVDWITALANLTEPRINL
eukprot:gene5733-6631_t